MNQKENNKNYQGSETKVLITNISNSLLLNIEEVLGTFL